MNHKKMREAVVFAALLCMAGCTAYPEVIESTSASSHAETESSEVPAVVTYTSGGEVINTKQVNAVLEEKNYPYRLKFMSEYVSTPAKMYEEKQKFLQDYDIVLAELPSWDVSLYREGLVSELDDQLLSLLPEDMYPKYDGKAFIFPSNFSYTQYDSLHADQYYAIVRNELVNTYGIHTLDDLNAYMLAHDDYTVADAQYQYFDLPMRTEFDQVNWNLGIHWDDEKEVFYNPYIEESEHIQLAQHIQMNVKRTEEDDADIIFRTHEKEGYTGIGYQPYMMNSFCQIGLMVAANAGPYAQQFIYDLYTDPDLSRAALPKWKEDGIFFGNLEFMTPELMRDYYDFDDFSYDDFVMNMQGTKTHLFNQGILMLDVCPMEEILEITEQCEGYSLGSVLHDPEGLQLILRKRPKRLDKMIEQLNQLYHEQSN